jgi:hypothetical protein
MMETLPAPAPIGLHGPNAREGLTISEVLSLDRRVSLYGVRISDMTPRGDLGLGLDPEGPVGFACIRGYRRRGGFVGLARPILLSVFGEGRVSDPSDIDARAGDRVWQAALNDQVLRLELLQGNLAALLDGDASPVTKLGVD